MFFTVHMPTTHEATTEARAIAERRMEDFKIADPNDAEAQKAEREILTTLTVVYLKKQDHFKHEHTVSIRLIEREDAGPYLGYLSAVAEELNEKLMSGHGHIWVGGIHDTRVSWDSEVS